MSPATSPARLLFSLLAVLAVLGPATAARAQSSSYGEPLGHLYVSSEATSRDPAITIPAFVPSRFYVVVDLDYADIGREELNGSVGIAAFEFGLEIDGLGSDFIVLGTNIRSISINVGDQTNVIAGLSPPVLADQTPIDLVEYTVLSPLGTAPTDVVVSLGPASPSSFPGLTPGWAESASVGECINPVSGAVAKCLRAFREISSAVINPTDLPPPTLEVSISDAEVPTGGSEVVTVEARLSAASGVLKSDPADLAGLDLELRWDGSLVALSEVRTADATTAWSLESNIAEGSVRISAANVEGLDLGLDSTALLELEFTGRGETGTTTVVADAFTFFDSAPEPIEVAGVAPGALDVIACDRYDPLDDDVVNSGDAIRALQIVTGQLFPDAETYCSADTDGDGTVDTGDVIRILRRAVGLEKTAVAPVAAASLGLDHEGASLRLRLEELSGVQGSLHYDPAHLRPVDHAGAGDGLVSVNNTEPGVIHFAVASTTPLDAELRVRFAPVDEAKVGVVRLADLRGFDAAGAPVETRSDRSEVSLRLGTPELFGTRLLAAVPNPFNPRTEIRFHLERAADVRLRIYDTAGREVRNLDRRALSAGDHGIEWNGLDDGGRRAASGVYFVKMRADGVEQGLRTVLLK